MSNKVSKRFRYRKFATGLLAIAAITVMLFTTGCASIDDELVGRWVFEADPSWVSTFNADGTGTHTQSWGYGTTFEWTTRGNNLRWSYPGYPNMNTPYRISGDALYITVDGGITYRYIRETNQT